MKIEMEVFSEEAARFIRTWLEEHRLIVLADMRSSIEREDGIRLLRAIDELLEYCGEC